MIAALLDLVGVIVGGLLNGVVSAGLERVRDAKRAVVVGRVVQDDLSTSTPWW
jgi:hypothetical protein